VRCADWCGRLSDVQSGRKGNANNLLLRTLEAMTAWLGWGLRQPPTPQSCAVPNGIIGA
jgi:hypothetical protein